MKNWLNIFFVSFNSSIKLDYWAAIADWNDRKNDRKEEKEEVNWNDEDYCHWIDCKNCCHEEDYKDCYHKKDCKDCCHDW